MKVSCVAPREFVDSEFLVSLHFTSTLGSNKEVVPSLVSEANISRTFAISGIAYVILR